MIKEILVEKPDILALFPDLGYSAVLEAHAGTGKTYTIIYAIIDYLIEKNINVEELLVVTFTEKATEELKKRIRKLLEDLISKYQNNDSIQKTSTKLYWEIDDFKYKKLLNALFALDLMQVSTIHGFCRKILTENAFFTQNLFSYDFCSDEIIYKEAFDKLLRNKTLFNENTINLSSFVFNNKNLTDIYKELKFYVRELKWKNAKLFVSSKKTQDEQNIIDFYNIAVKIYLEEIEKIKEKNNVVTTDDLVLFVYKTLQSKTKHLLINSLRNKYKVALVDEFQDTDMVQWNIFSTLFMNSTNHSLIIIGDPKQSIYRFRGADFNTWFNAVQTITKTKDKLLLNTNFRSTNIMIEACNFIFFYDTGTKKFFSNKDLSQTKPVFYSNNHDNQIVYNNTAIKPINLINFYTEKKENNASIYIKFIISTIITLLKENINLKLNDILILSRKNTELIKIEEQLKNANLAFVTVADKFLFESKEALEIKSILQAIYDPHNDNFISLALNTNFFNYTFEQINNKNENIEIAIKKIYYWHNLSKKNKLIEIIEDIIAKTNIIKKELLFGMNERALTNYLQITQHLELMLIKKPQSLLDLILKLSNNIENAQQLEEYEELETERDAIKLMTFHKSKGLEAKVVFIYAEFKSREELIKWPQIIKDNDNYYVCLDKNVDDNIKLKIKNEEQEDVERLYYVALTRAKETLFLPFYENQTQDENKIKGEYQILNARFNILMNYNKQKFDTYINIYRIDNVNIEHYNNATNFNNTIQIADDYSLLKEQLIDNAHSECLHSYSSIKRNIKIFNSFKDLENLDKFLIWSNFAEKNTTQIPKGAEFGILIHKLLEITNIDYIRNITSKEDWCKNIKIQELIKKEINLTSYDESIIDICNDFIYLAWKSPIAYLNLPNGLADIKFFAREVPFFINLHNLNNLTFADFNIDNDILRGFIDAVFIHNDKIYFIDWKTDNLKNYSTTELQQHYINENYELQKQIYLLALQKIFNTEIITNKYSIGGGLYIFLRGLGQQEGILVCN